MKENCLTAYVFNHPIQLQREIFWPGQEGPLFLYGVTINSEPDQKVQDDVDGYLGYLAMCEEFCQNGITPSGYTAGPDGDLAVWVKGDSVYGCYDDAVLQECALCKEKQNLKAYATPLNQELANEVDGEFILSREVYEALLSNVVNVDD